MRIEEKVVRTMLNYASPEPESSDDESYRDASDLEGIEDKNHNRKMLTPNLKLNDKKDKLTRNEISLEEALEDGRQMMIKFIDNGFDEAVSMIFEKGDTNFVYAAGMGVIKSMEGLLSMSPEHIQEAMSYMRFANEFASNLRKKASVTSLLTFRYNFDYNSYTDEEAHAELIFAGTSIALGLLSIIGDQSIYGLINAAFTIRSSHGTYKECLAILENKTNWGSDRIKMHFESGTRLGIGAFDLFVSMFPNKLAKLLEYVGFSSDREVALEELNKSVNLPDGYMYDLSSILLSTYYGFVEYFFGCGDPELWFFEQQSKVWARRTPNSSIARIGVAIQHQISGQPDASIDHYNKCVFDNSVVFKQLELASYWGLCGCYTMKMDWRNAAKYIKILKDGCKWSPALFTYLYAVFQYMVLIEEGGDNPELEEEIATCLKKIPQLKRTVGGRKVFHEKIVIERSKRFHNNIKDMVLPPLELIYIWNMFQMMYGNEDLIKPFLKLVDDKFVEFKDDKDDEEKNLDTYTYLVFMRGVCLRHLNRTEEAIDTFLNVLSLKKRITENHLLAQSCFELGSIHRKAGNLIDAKKWFKKARDDYSNYMTEIMIQHRSNHMLKCIKRELKSDEE